VEALGSAISVHRDQLTVEDHDPNRDRRNGAGDRSVLPGGVLQVPGVQADAIAVLHREGPVPIKLDLIGPGRPGGEHIGERGQSGVAELKTLPS
jgi:hypothetical protein